MSKTESRSGLVKKTEIVVNILNDIARTCKAYKKGETEARTLRKAAGILQRIIREDRKEHLEMESVKLMAECRFIQNCKPLIEERDAGGHFNFVTRLEEFYAHIETLGRDLSAFVVGDSDEITELIQLFAIGLSPDEYIDTPLEFVENAFYSCGQTVGEVALFLEPDIIDIPGPDNERIKEALRVGIAAGLENEEE
jgi:hypothetical protein